MYVGTLQPMGIDNELLVQLFQRSLTGPALTWLMKTNPNTIRAWPDLANAFVTHYAYNTDTQLSRRKLELVKQTLSLSPTSSHSLRGEGPKLLRFKRKETLGGRSNCYGLEEPEP